MADCLITGTIRDVHGAPLAGISIFVEKVQLSGTVIEYHSSRVDVSDALGIVSFILPRSSRAWISGRFFIGSTSFSVKGGVAVDVPNTATANLESLGAAVTGPTNGLTLEVDGIPLPGLYNTLQTESDTMEISTPSTGVALLIPLGGGGGVSQSALNVVSNGLSAEIANRLSADALLSGRVNSVGAFGASVTSQEFSVVTVNIGVVSTALSIETAARIAKDDLISNAVSVVSQALSAETSSRVAGDASLANAISVVSQAVSAETSARIAADNTLSNAISVVSTALSNEISVRSAANVSLAQGISVVSQALSAETSARTAAVNTVSAAVVSVNDRVSGISANVSTISANVTSIAGRLDTVSNLVSTVASALSARINTVSNAVSALSVGALKGVSAPTPLDQQVLLWDSVKAQWIPQSVAAGGVGSVTSNELSAAALGLSTRIDTQSQGISVLSQQVSALSQSLSSQAAGLSVRIDTVSNAASINSAAILSVNNRVSGISAAVSSLSADLTSTQNRVSANSALVSTIASALSARIDTVSQALSALVLDSVKNVSVPSPSDQQVLTWNSAQAQWVAVSVAAGSGSVTSNELSAAAQGLSTRIDTASNAASVADAHANTVSAAVVVVSNLVSTVASALSVRIDTLSNAGSVHSVAIDAVSAAVVSVNNRISGVSAAVSSLSADVTSVKDRVSAISANVSSISANVTSVAGRLDTVSALVSTVASALSTRVDTVSNAVSVLSAALSTQMSAMSQAQSALSAYVNKGIGSEFDGGLASTASVIINWANGGAQKFDLSGVPSFSATGLSAGRRYLIRLSLGTSAAHSANWSSVFVWDGGTPPVLGGSSAIEIIPLYSDGTNLYGGSDPTAVSVTSAELSAVSAAANRGLRSLNDVSGAVVDGQVPMWNSADAKFHFSTVAAGTGSVTSTELSAVSAAALSALSNTASALSVRIDTVSQAHSALSQAHSALSAYVKKAVDSEFNGGLVSTASVTIDWANGGAQKFDVSGVPSFANPSNMSAGRRYILRLSEGTSAAHSANWASAFVWPGGTPPSLGGSSAVDLLAFYCDGTNLLGSYGATGGAGSVTSTELSAVSAAAAASLSTTASALSARIDTNSQMLSVLSQQVSVLSQQISVVSAAQAATSAAVNAISAGLGGVQMKVVGGAQFVSAVALTKISGLSASVAAAGVYQLEGFLIAQGSTMSVYGLGMSTSAATFTNGAGFWRGNNIVGMGTYSNQLSTGIGPEMVGYWNEASFGSVTYSVAVSTPAGANFMIQLKGVVALSTAGGSIQLKAKAGGSGVITIKAGSYLKAFKIA